MIWLQYRLARVEKLAGFLRYNEPGGDSSELGERLVGKDPSYLDLY